ncbi:hypothetical protein DFA_09004 [Cavenderia fasciculata]|uniref:tRNA (uracil-O(2)-)-methyltransferase n=1 Tax=Cavenderia fasciculata TaxID=261658 RepID=F4Q6F6_CACFS|nr:uncharacterized protein DFA_09004 [Cavenderia fasciculata]EGG16466.1 hypothetical protein DFA_09004 [Cavenderia fasciculata]|eukprot:XP_004354866.1 hypothetical protein DFA_09004 [Cavenderia fasciculata]
MDTINNNTQKKDDGSSMTTTMTSNEWTIIQSLDCNITNLAFWYVMEKWAYNPQHTLKPVKKYYMISKTTLNDQNSNNPISTVHYHSNNTAGSDTTTTSTSSTTTTSTTSTSISSDGQEGDDVQDRHHSNENEENGGGLISEEYLGETDNVDDDESKPKISKIIYKRHIIPRVIEKDNEIDEIITHDLLNVTSTYSPVFPNQESMVPLYLPFFYPKVVEFRYRFVNNNNNKRKFDQEIDNPTKNNNNNNNNNNNTIPNSTIYFEVKYFSREYQLKYLEILKNLGKELLCKVGKWGSNYTTYQKHAHYDRVVPRSVYIDQYEILKEKYKSMATNWYEVTCCDPQKYVYEDVAIAAYLICLWKMEETSKSLTTKQSFVDLGCGNGLLVNILNMEGYNGIGVDIRSRKVWKYYDEKVQSKLIVESVIPDQVDYSSYDWLIGNHSDELTPWVPFIASKTPNQRFFLLPCCFFNFSKKFQDNDKKIGQYATYLNYIENISTRLGFTVTKDALRIPSTKNIAIISTSCTTITDTDELIKSRQKLLDQCNYKSFTARESEVGKYAPQKRYKPGQFNPHLGIIMPDNKKNKKKINNQNNQNTNQVDNNDEK